MSGIQQPVHTEPVLGYRLTVIINDSLVSHMPYRAWRAALPDGKRVDW